MAEANPPGLQTENGLEASFRCSLCGEEAGRVRLYAPGEAIAAGDRPGSKAVAELDRVVRRIRPAGQVSIVVETFYGVESHSVFPDRIESLSKAIRAADAAALYGITYAYAPFHCPDCGADYCGSHWSWERFEDEFHSGVSGQCPRGHFHVLMY